MTGSALARIRPELEAGRDRVVAAARGLRPVPVPGLVGVLGRSNLVYVVEEVPVGALLPAARELAPGSLVLVSRDLSTGTDDALLADGWAFRRHLELMTCDGSPRDMPAPGDVTVEEVDPSSLPEAQALSDLAFGFVAPIGRVHEEPAAGSCSPVRQPETPSPSAAGRGRALRRASPGS